jgi:signal transduction histidine kinase
MLAIAAAMLVLIAVLATLQYRWLGRISDAERERLTATLGARADACAKDFDRELALAYMLFQLDPVIPGAPGDEREASLPTRLTARHERWQATARYSKLIRDIYVTEPGGDRPAPLQRFNPSTHLLEPVEWPASLTPIRGQLGEAREEKTANGAMFVRTMAPVLWEQIPALVVPGAPVPMFLLNTQPAHAGARPGGAPPLAYVVLVLDRQYIAGEMLPALAAHHFAATGEDPQYQIAVVEAAKRDVVFRSAGGFTPPAADQADARADLFQIRLQEFPQLVADVRRFTALIGPDSSTVSQTMAFRLPVVRGTSTESQGPPPAPSGTTQRPDGTATPGTWVDHQLVVQESRPTRTLGQTGGPRDRSVLTTVTGTARSNAGKWQLVVKHPAGSLEAAVETARRRNVLISSGILGLLAASMVMMLVSTRRSQQLARQQMEFVAAVSHELRTPLAVVRSAADNLADGLVHEPEQVRKYGALVRGEGRRLTEMVEQILELAGIHSGQRTFTPVAVRVDTLVDSVLRASGALIEDARISVDVDLPADLPAVAGDEAALRRVFQNLVGNAIKYGVEGKWIGIAARHAGHEVRISVSDRGIGIAPGDHERIFEPFYRAGDVVSAQVQGAGLGLSLVRRIVEAHGGRITVKSAKAAGSEFTVHLPAASERPESEPAPAGAGRNPLDLSGATPGRSVEASRPS